MTDIAAYLRAEKSGRWRLWVDVPGVPPERQPGRTFPAGSGPSVAARTSALAVLGFTPEHPGPWGWVETSPEQGVLVLGVMPVRSSPVLSGSGPRTGVSTGKGSARKAAVAGPRTPAVKKVAAAPRRPSVPAGTRQPARSLDAGPKVPAALPARQEAARPAALPPAAPRRPAELPARQPLALPVAERPRSLLSALVDPRDKAERNRPRG